MPQLMSRAFFAPEVVQTSNLDCGPASLKSLLEGFGIAVSYGRLREECQTSLDGTSIDTMELVAQQLGLDAEQIMLPLDHVTTPEGNAIPSIVVVKLPSGLTHFVVLWRKHGSFVQIMDPAQGRRWMSTRRFASDLFQHTVEVPASDWRDFAIGREFQAGLYARLRALGIGRAAGEELQKKAADGTNWYSLAALDAATRVTAALAESGAVHRGQEAHRFIAQFVKSPDLIPARYWSVRGDPNAGNDGLVLVSGAVLVRAKCKRADALAEAADGGSVHSSLKENTASPGWELMSALWQSGAGFLSVAALALIAAAGGTIIEALLFRTLFDVSGSLALAGQRIGAISAVLLFGTALLLLDFPLFFAGARAGRQVENRLRIAFLQKIPRLADRYFQSRLTSDMAERSHLTHRLRHLPDLLRQLLRAILELLATAAGIIWLDPPAAPLVSIAVSAALVPAFSTQSLLAERDLRVRSHAAGLTRFYLDAMLGLSAIRAHGAEQNVRREHDSLLRHWTDAALRLQKAAVLTEAIQLAVMFGLIATLLLARPLAGAQIGRTLLLVYWALNLPTLGQDIAALARQYPYYRNLTLRLLEPLGAPEEEPTAQGERLSEFRIPPAIEFVNVSAEASGHSILHEINVRIKGGTHLAIVGPSGAGKSSFIGVLLGWLKPSAGSISVDGEPLDCTRVRQVAAWLDPAVQLWNDSLLSNLEYGTGAGEADIARAVDAALLRQVLENLPDGLQTKLGEGGGLVSGGEGQRVRLARALLRKNTQLVLLDEPFRGLDREKRRDLLDRARRYWRGKTMLCVTHDIAETKTFDRVLVMEGGTVIEDGKPHELARDHTSRYAQLLAAEVEARSGLWGASLWRRIRIHRGQALEEVPAVKCEEISEIEVA